MSSSTILLTASVLFSTAAQGAGGRLIHRGPGGTGLGGTGLGGTGLGGTGLGGTGLGGTGLGGIAGTGPYNAAAKAQKYGNYVIRFRIFPL